MFSVSIRVDDTTCMYRMWYCAGASDATGAGGWVPKVRPVVMPVAGPLASALLGTKTGSVLAEGLKGSMDAKGLVGALHCIALLH